MSAAGPQEQAQTVPTVEPERVASPTPSAKKRFSALQQLKKLGGKLKKSKKADAIPEDSAPAVEIEEDIERVDVVGELDIAKPPAPATLAEHIRTVVSLFARASKPTPRPAAIHTKDEKLISLLSNPEVMNGSPDDGRISVWEALNALSAPKRQTPPGSNDTPAPGDDEQIQGDVMLYCPLHPTEDSTVQLAETQTVEVPLTHKDSLWQSRWNLLWSWTLGLMSPSTPKTKLVTKWVPSTTQVSFQALWWGYRMYLPPPVMAHLTSDEAETVKIATTITAVLTWFLAHVDTSSIPPPLLPAFLVLQKLGPYAGYIGTFISWIWGTVTNADKGNGVVLTATWVLPVVLIPSAIKAPDASASAAPPTTASVAA
ncbi:hypothetical protein MSAN_01285400 [Mycena sanguinolenta]|uniref:Uncharacterized protein n=1 Tax=Mycena sanguinolenta TaxID=230812 RepID=A0A8H7D5D8_9AGAR|nr:hypothetical protein MSAN_01285400 [Mycena sanguinolenta]